MAWCNSASISVMSHVKCPVSCLVTCELRFQWFVWAHCTSVVVLALRSAYLRLTTVSLVMRRAHHISANSCHRHVMGALETARDTDSPSQFLNTSSYESDHDRAWSWSGEWHDPDPIASARASATKARCTISGDSRGNCPQLRFSGPWTPTPILLKFLQFSSSFSRFRGTQLKTQVLN